MTRERNDNDGEPDNAVLSDTVHLDTTSISWGQTAQVKVALPDLRDQDDDLVDDELPPAADLAPEHEDVETITGEVEPVDDEVTHESEPDELDAVPEEQPRSADVDVVAPAPTPAVDRRADRRARTSEVQLHSRRLGDLDAGRESADLLTADRLLDPAHVVKPEPEGLWQNLLYRASGKRINLGDSKGVRARKHLDTQIGAHLAGVSRFVPVLSRKGGVGKTTITTLLGMALADARDDRIIAIDANPDRGTLAERISHSSGRTVRDLVKSSDEVAGWSDVSAIVGRDATRLDVLASDTDPHISEAFGDEDYAAVARVAAHYYSIVLTDTGTGIVHSVMEATLHLADQVVIVAGLTVDEARLASETLTWLETNGYDDLVRDAVVVLNSSRPGAPVVRADELESHFTSRVRTVVQVPYDPHLAAGSAVTFRDLSEPTRLAARTLAAAVVDGLRSRGAAA